jgi:hypothetical protein
MRIVIALVLLAWTPAHAACGLLDTCPAPRAHAPRARAMVEARVLQLERRVQLLEFALKVTAKRASAAHARIDAVAK